MNSNSDSKPKTKVWDLPLRLWHWLLAGLIFTSLITGWIGDIDQMEIHIWSGMAVVSLIVFRILWGIWGGTYARFKHYRTSSRAIVDHFFRRNSQSVHTAPGIAMAICMVVAIAVQSMTGLFTSDDIFNEGPFVRFATDEIVKFAGFVHHRAWWFIAGLIAIHLLAQAIYGLILRSNIPLAMITGAKSGTFPAMKFSAVHAILTCAITAVFFFAIWFFAY